MFGLFVTSHPHNEVLPNINSTFEIGEISWTTPSCENPILIGKILLQDAIPFLSPLGVDFCGAEHCWETKDCIKNYEKACKHQPIEKCSPPCQEGKTNCELPNVYKQTISCKKGFYTKKCFFGNFPFFNKNGWICG